VQEGRRILVAHGGGGATVRADGKYGKLMVAVVLFWWCAGQQGLRRLAVGAQEEGDGGGCAGTTRGLAGEGRDARQGRERRLGLAR
jgi:hypothetical protein